MASQATTGSGIDLERAVRDNYKGVYRFAMHLTRNEQDAADLTQFAYEQLASKHGEIRDASRVKAWLNSVVYRKFIDQQRKVIRFPSVTLDDEPQLPMEEPADASTRMDARAALDALHELEEDLRAPLSLFYLESVSYKEIAEILKLPLGTVMSRLYRGKARLYQILTGKSQ